MSRAGDEEAYMVRADEREEHPEARCERCKRSNIVWFTKSELWNSVNPAESVLCPVCFVESAEASGVKPTGWELAPERHDPEGKPCPTL